MKAWKIGIVVLIAGGIIAATVWIERGTRAGCQVRAAGASLSAAEHALREMGWYELEYVPIEEMLASDDLMFILRGIGAYEERIGEELGEEIRRDDYETDEAHRAEWDARYYPELRGLIPVLERAADRDAVRYAEGSFRGGVMQGESMRLGWVRVCARMLVQDAERLIEAGDGAAAAERYATVLDLYYRVADDVADHLVFLVCNASIKIAADSVGEWHESGEMGGDAARRLADAMREVRGEWWAVAKRAIEASADSHLREMEEVLSSLPVVSKQDEADLAEARGRNARYGELHRELMEAWDGEDFEQQAMELVDNSGHAEFEAIVPALLRTRKNVLLVQDQLDELIDRLEGGE